MGMKTAMGTLRNIKYIYKPALWKMEYPVLILKKPGFRFHSYAL